MKKTILYFALLFLVLTATAQKNDLNYYLPQDISYNQNIPTPESILGFQVGDWHVSHDKLAEYMKALAKSSASFFVYFKSVTFTPTERINKFGF